ncbi:MAG TPA: LuxR C-terminal-related transcriptional regulator [Trebonia sp.]|jgi:LuxR family maltose regulon positive regulatory protein|nr:LuxR C-terminal-related transcriptional regulator [Trebonia sp.]
MTVDGLTQAVVQYCPAPAVQTGAVARRGLFARLAAAGRVTQVSAPAGSGKTYLLRSWITEFGLGDCAAWASVQDGQRDPQQFWISVLDALRETIAGLKLVRPLTGAPDLDGWAIVERLLEDLEPLEDQLLLVVDDIHELRSAEALAQLELLVMRSPAKLRFVFVTRRDVRIGLHRLRLEGNLTEIRTADLQFTVGEARTLFEAAGVELPESALVALVQRTEGWAAGLRLAALSLAGHPDPGRFAAEFSGSDRTVAEFLLAEVLDHQPERVRRLLLRTSVCERVSGELADLITGETGGERILQDLEQAGAFVVSLDGRRSWFRYHRLFADLLRLELRRAEPGTLADLHNAAAGWYAEQGFVVEAVRHAQSAQDWGTAARLLSHHFLSLTLDGQGATARELLARFPADIMAADPKLSVLMLELFLCGSLEAAECHLVRAEEAIASVPEECRERFEVNLIITRLSLAQKRGDLPAVAEQAQRLLAPAEAADAAAPALDEDLRALALISLGSAELWALRAGEAERHLDEGGALASRIGRPWLEVSSLAHAGWAASFRSFTLGAERFTQAIGLAAENGWTEEPIVASAYVGLGAIRVWQMRLDEAEELLAHAERAFRAEIEPAAGLLFHQTRGMLELARGHEASALAAYRAAARLAGLLITAHPRAAPMRSQMLQTLVRLGETGRVEQAVAGPDETERGEMRNAVAALRLAQRNPRAAVAALAPVLDGTAPVCNAGWLSQAFWLEAIARDALGDPAAARCALESALDLAEPAGAVFAFLVHPAPELLRRHASRGTAHAALITEILGMLSSGEPPPPRKGTDLLVEPLSGSETRILRFLPTNLSAPEIAGQLSVSVNTVRTHMRHVYAKLGTHSRTEAVEQARTLGLLAPSAHRRLVPDGRRAPRDGVPPPWTTGSGGPKMILRRPKCLVLPWKRGMEPGGAAVARWPRALFAR